MQQQRLPSQEIELEVTLQDLYEGRTFHVFIAFMKM